MLQTYLRDRWEGRVCAGWAGCRCLSSAECQRWWSVCRQRRQVAQKRRRTTRDQHPWSVADWGTVAAAPGHHFAGYPTGPPAHWSETSHREKTGLINRLFNDIKHTLHHMTVAPVCHIPALQPNICCNIIFSEGLLTFRELNNEKMHAFMWQHAEIGFESRCNIMWFHVFFPYAVVILACH